MSPRGGCHHGNIPVVDLGQLNIKNESKSVSKEEWSRVGREISTAFSDIGFVYLTNHGVEETVVRNVHQYSQKFFDYSHEVKEKYSRASLQHGYVAINREKLSVDAKRIELRESYDVRILNGNFPDSQVPQFKPSVQSLVQNCLQLAKHLLTALEIGLDCPRGLLTESHKHLMSEINATCLRVLHYPAVPDDIKAGAIRCGSHTDYGTITLLFQDCMGGLEVRDRSGRWVAADPLPGAVLVNVGDLLQMWTGNKFIATEHRVLIPAEEIKKKSPRRSAVFFIHPDDDVLVKPLDGASSHAPVTAKQHVDRRFKETYQY